MITLPVLAQPTALVTAGRCNGCGNCCQRITLRRSWWEWMQSCVAAGEWNGHARSNQDGAFIAAHWHLTGDAPPDGHVVVDCDAFDPATRRCTRYFERPPVCRDYPWYDGRPDPARLHGQECGYWLDLPMDTWPKDATLETLTNGRT